MKLYLSGYLQLSLCKGISSILDLERWRFGGEDSANKFFIGISKGSKPMIDIFPPLFNSFNQDKSNVDTRFFFRGLDRNICCRKQFNCWIFFPNILKIEDIIVISTFFL